MSIPHALLGLLETEPLHGYELKHRYDRSFAPENPLPFGQVYAALERLERGGRVEVAAIEMREDPERRRFAITHEGDQHLAEWIPPPLEPEPHLRSALYAK